MKIISYTMIMKNNWDSGTSKISIKEIVTLVAIILLAFLLRLYKLGDESFWVDEIGHIQAASQKKFGLVLEQIRIHSGAAPLDYLILRKLIPIIGLTNDGLFRIPYAIYGGISVLLTYILARRNFGLWAGYLSAFLLCISPIHIRYSQEVRFYSLSVLFSLLSFLCFDNAIRKKTIKSWFIWGLVSLLSFYTFYFYIFIYIIQLLYIVWLGYGLDKEKTFTTRASLSFSREYKPALLSALISLILFMPWFIWDQTYHEVISMTLPELRFKTAIQNVLNQFGGDLSFPLFLILSIFSIYNMGKTKLYLFIFFGSLLGSFIVDLIFGYFFSPRHILFSLPFFLISVSVGICLIISSLMIKPKVIYKNMALAILIFLVLISYIFPNGLILISYYNNMQKPAWFLVANYLASELGEDETIIVFTHVEKKSLLYYLEKERPGHDFEILISSDETLCNQIIREDLDFILVSEQWMDMYPDFIKYQLRGRLDAGILIENIYVLKTTLTCP